LKDPDRTASILFSLLFSKKTMLLHSLNFVHARIQIDRRPEKLNFTVAGASFLIIDKWRKSAFAEASVKRGKEPRTHQTYIRSRFRMSGHRLRRSPITIESAENRDIGSICRAIAIIFYDITVKAVKA